MAEDNKSPQETEEEPIPAWQSFFDSIGILFFLGVAIPTLVFTVWGLMEIANVPSLPLLK